MIEEWNWELSFMGKYYLHFYSRINTKRQHSTAAGTPKFLRLIWLSKLWERATQKQETAPGSLNSNATPFSTLQFSVTPISGFDLETPFHRKTRRILHRDQNCSPENQNRVRWFGCERVWWSIERLRWVVLRGRRNGEFVELGIAFTGAAMDVVPGSVGTGGSFSLRLGQAVFSSASLLFMSLGIEFYSYTAFWWFPFSPFSLDCFWFCFLWFVWSMEDELIDLKISEIKPWWDLGLCSWDGWMWRTYLIFVTLWLLGSAKLLNVLFKETSFDNACRQYNIQITCWLNHSTLSCEFIWHVIYASMPFCGGVLLRTSLRFATKHLLWIYLQFCCFKLELYAKTSSFTRFS